jgi:DNA-binding MarR family transcriptional regulator
MTIAMTRDPQTGNEQALAEFRYQLRRFLHFSEGAARAAGLEPQQHQLLLALRGLDGGGEVTIGGLAERLVLRHNSTVELVNRMARRGLVCRMRAPEDHRRVLVHITARGGRVLERLSRHHLSELRSAGPQLIRALESVVAGSSRKRTRRAARRAVPGKQG